MNHSFSLTLFSLVSCARYKSRVYKTKAKAEKQSSKLKAIQCLMNEVIKSAKLFLTWVCEWKSIIHKPTTRGINISIPRNVLFVWSIKWNLMVSGVSVDKRKGHVYSVWRDMRPSFTASGEICHRRSGFNALLLSPETFRKKFLLDCSCSVCSVNVCPGASFVSHYVQANIKSNGYFDNIFIRKSPLF